MPEMLVLSPPNKRIVSDYDIIFESGMMMPLVVDATIGDTINFMDNRIDVRLVPRTSQNDPSKTLPAEEITIFLNHVLSIQHRKREIVEQTPEELENWREEFRKLTSKNGTVM